MFQKQKEQGVSPVIGVILMVIVTVALAALAANFVFNVSGNSGQQAAVTVNWDDEVSNYETTALVVKNENVDKLQFTGSNITDYTISNPSAGDRSKTFSVGEGDEITVIATVDGSEQVIETHTVG